jgi:uncharacterized membrane protein
VTRIEGFTDAVFAFAVTLLVVSLEVPRTFDELQAAMHGFLAFAICFAMLFAVWFDHYRFFRRYGLQDTITLTLNGVLLFVVLFYVYPLKFLFTLLTDQVFGGGERGGPPAIRSEQIPALMVIYGVGFLAISLLFVVLYARALAKREQLQLSPMEVFDTRESIQGHVINAAVGALSVGLALSPGWHFAGPVYFLLGPARAVHGWIMGRKRHHQHEERRNR